MPATGASTVRPRVLLLIKGLGLGGAERLLVDVVSHRGHEFDYQVAYVLSGQNALVPAMRAAGVVVHDLGASGSTDVRWMLRLRHLLGVGRFDILHFHLPYSAAMGRLVALSLPRRRRPALVYTEHSLWNKAAIVTKALNGSTVALDSALFVVSTAARDALPPRLRARAQVVVHGVDRARFAFVEGADGSLRTTVRGELGVLEGEILALTVANLRAEKGHDVLLEAARLTVAQGVPARFVSVGRGPLEGSLRRAADAAGLDGRFELLGPRTDIVRLMAGADVFVLPSHQEGLPVALMEAMSAGLPVVVTAVGGVPGIVTDGVEGLVVPPGRPELLAQALVLVMSDQPLRSRLAVAARARSEDFDVARAVAVIEAAYAKILEER